MDDEEIRELYGWAKRMAARKVPFWDVGEVSNDIVLAVVCSIEKLREKKFYHTWRETIARRRIVDYYRQQQKQSRYLETAKEKWLRLHNRRRLGSPRVRRIDFASENSDEFVGCAKALCYQDHSALEFMDIVRTLPANLRDALLLHILYGLNYGEIGEREGISYEGARSRVRRARKELRERYAG